MLDAEAAAAAAGSSAHTIEYSQDVYLPGVTPARLLACARAWEGTGDAAAADLDEAAATAAWLGPGSLTAAVTGVDTATVSWRLDDDVRALDLLAALAAAFTAPAAGGALAA